MNEKQAEWMQILKEIDCYRNAGAISSINTDLTLWFGNDENSLCVDTATHKIKIEGAFLVITGDGPTEVVRFDDLRRIAIRSKDSIRANRYAREGKMGENERLWRSYLETRNCVVEEPDGSEEVLYLAEFELRFWFSKGDQEYAASTVTHDIILRGEFFEINEKSRSSSTKEILSWNDLFRITVEESESD